MKHLHQRHASAIQPQQPATRTPGTTLCNQGKCKTCPFISTAINVQRPKSEMNITKQFSCQTYIIYIIDCTKCYKLYISKTECTLNTCFKEHLADIKHHREKPVANHFNQARSVHDIHVKWLWVLFTDNASDRKDMETHLIDKLGSRTPGGMNENL